MQQYFYELSERIIANCQNDEILLLSLEGETSDFTRFNQALIRQAGSVDQNQLHLTLISRGKQATCALELTRQFDLDLATCKHHLDLLKQQVPHLPQDPYINYAQEINSTQDIIEHPLPSSHSALEQIFELSCGLDLVGIWANGHIYRGFANSLGQKNWHSQNSFNFDWSIYQQEDKAVKCGYAGFEWQLSELEAKFRHAKEAAQHLQSADKTLKPGKYRVYLSPSANRELLDMMSWGGFGLKSHKSQHTPLLKMVTENWQLHPEFCLVENHQAGLTPSFTHHGFIKPEKVTLIKQGKYNHCLINPRSAKEFSETSNCDQEHPDSLQLSPGNIDQDKVLSTLDTGIYINNLWYCNFSDHNHCRITGMTRFACFWVEKGEIVAPVNVMRFDDSIYNIFGKNLVGLTHKQETILDAGSYEQRSTASYHIPGAIVNDLSLTL